jgi:hypothetical protein
MARHLYKAEIGPKPCTLPSDLGNHEIEAMISALEVT